MVTHAHAGRVSYPLALGPIEGEPLVSILIANYNYERFIGEALESISAQSYPRLEAIVCDDGSVDRSCAVVERHAQRDERIRLLRQPNGGAAAALNNAFRSSSGEIVLLLDADDLFERDKVEVVVKAMRAQDCGVLVHPLVVVDEVGRAIQLKPAFSRFEAGWIAPTVARRGGRWSYMEASAVCLRRAVAERLFPIPEEQFRTWADAYLCTLGAFLTEVGYVDEALARYRIHGANSSGFNSFSEDHGRRAMGGFTRLIAGVNSRLPELRPDLAPLRVEDNLAYLESRLQADLFGATPRAELARTFATYARRVVRDEIYGSARKALSLVFMGGAILVPSRLRARWLTLGLTHSRPKELIRRLVRRGRLGGSRRSPQRISVAQKQR
jgi:glycosyltransferase involved in cell wall biosynthesis